MNIILFESQEDLLCLSLEDPRARHICDVLKVAIGGSLYVGVVNGPTGKATIVDKTPTNLFLEVIWEDSVAPLYPLHLLIGLPRPQTARKILQTCTSLGVSTLHFFKSEKGEPNYAQSTLWTTAEWETHLQLGAEQAFATTVPRVFHYQSLQEALDSNPSIRSRVALDVYETDLGLEAFECSSAESCIAAIGPERGWSASERNLLRAKDFKLVSLGTRVLRTETACVAASTLLLAKLGCFEK